LWITTRPLANASKICCGQKGIQNSFAHLASDFIPGNSMFYIYFFFRENVAKQNQFCSKTRNVVLY
jgi:hypothetical protein